MKSRLLVVLALFGVVLIGCGKTEEKKINDSVGTVYYEIAEDSSERGVETESSGNVSTESENNDVKSESSDVKSENNSPDLSSLAKRNVHFAGFNDMTLNKDSIVKLENPIENDDFVMQFIITGSKTKNIVFKSDFIKSGEYVDWKPYNDLGYGEFDVIIAENPYWEYEGEYIPLTVGNNELHISIVEAQ